MPKVTDKAISGLLMRTLAEQPLGRLGALAIRRPSTVPAGSAEDIAGLGTAPSFKQWAERRVKVRPNAFDYRIVNKPWYNAGVVPLSMVLNDHTPEQVVMQWVADFAAARPLLFEEIVADLIINAATYTCFDGKAFFADDHEYANSGAFDNKIALTATDADVLTVEEAAEGILSVINSMRVFPDDQGRKIANRDMTSVLVVYPAGSHNAAVISRALSADKVDTGSGTIENPLKGAGVTITGLADGLLTGSMADESFAVIRNDARAKVFITQTNTAESYYKVLTDDRTIVDQDGWEVAAKEVIGAGYGLPSHAALGTFANG